MINSLLVWTLYGYLYIIIISPQFQRAACVFIFGFKGLLVCSFLFMVLQLVENKTSESRNGICQYPFPFVHSCNMTLTVSQVSG